MDKTTERLASYAADLAYGDLTPKAIHETKRCVVDSVGCALGAFDAAPVKAIRAMASRVRADKPATLIGTRTRTAIDLAGFVNGTMIRYLDFSDDYFGEGERQAGPHPSDNIGSILAAAESIGADGKTLILGIALAYEACNQLVDRAILHAHRGWDHPIMHAVATSLAAGKVLGLTREQLGHALGLAVVPNVCLRQTRRGELSNWKAMAGPNGCRNGLFAALLAKEGVTGPGEPFEGTAGFMKQLDTPFELGDLGGRGAPFRIERTFFKWLPVMYASQLLVWTALALREKIRLEEVESIVCYVDAYLAHGDAFTAERWNPRTRETADHSGPYLIGAALVDGGITADTMTPQRYRDPGILALIQKIRVEEDKNYSPAYPECRLEATLKSGEVVTVHRDRPKGHVLNPLSDDEIEHKFLRQAEPLLTKRRSRALLDSVWNLENLSDVGALLPLMVVRGRKQGENGSATAGKRRKRMAPDSESA